MSTGLPPGARLGPYEIVALIGAGGMGEVYRANDSRLDRQVAIKVLPTLGNSDDAARARFEREARAVGALSHPNIVAIHDVGTVDATTYLVMELLEGETLRARLDAARGGLPVKKALEIAAQIAQGLGAAHAKGIVHRDVKPENVFLTTDGRVKVLDFGIARALSGSSDSEMPTATSLGAGTGTRPGTVLGTVGYMAPEQIRGQAADHRADIFALGAVLFEMLTGERAFAGESAIETMSAILRVDPLEHAERSASVPANCLVLIRRCLEKQTSERFESMRDLAFQLQALRPSATVSEPVAIPRSSGVRRQLVQFAIVGVTTGLTAAMIVWRLVGVQSSDVTHAQIDTSPAEGFVSSGATPAGGFRRALDWSPDGRTLAFVARQAGTSKIHLRSLGRDEAIPLAGTEGAETLEYSPDGRWIAFWAGGQIRKLPADGGPIAKVCDAVSFHGMTWRDASRIVYAGNRQLLEVPADGGASRTVLDTPNARLASPDFLPGSTVMLFTEHRKAWTSGDERVMLLSLPGGSPELLIDHAADASYVASGHIVFLRQGTLFAVPFDVGRLKLRGPEVAILTGVSQVVTVTTNSNLTLIGQYRVSPQGTLAYLSQPLVAYPPSELVAVDRHGDATPIGAPVRAYTPILGLSSAGDRFAVTAQTLTEKKLWMFDSTRPILQPFTHPGEASAAVWMGDSRIAFIQFVDWRTQLVILRVESPTPMEIVADSDAFWPTSWSEDRKCIAGARGGSAEFHVWVFCPDGPEPRLRQVFSAPGSQEAPTWSPDGRWLAYSSSQGGGNEVFVRPYPGPGAELQISMAGGREPVWNPAGRELFYIEPHPGASRMMSVAIETMPAFRPGTPRSLFSFDPGKVRFQTSVSHAYEVSPDGQRFYTTRFVPQPPSAPITHINLIVNWLEELKAKAPVAR